MLRSLTLLALFLTGAAGARAQTMPAPQNAPLALTLDEAREIARVQSYVLQSVRLDVDNAEAQVREAWAGVLPDVQLSSSYTRNVKSPNPFAGSDAGGLFGSLGFVDWLAYNERARTDDDPGTAPISFDAFGDSLQTGYNRAGINLSQGDNPFSVPNAFQNQISITQTLYNGAAFAAIRGAEKLMALNERSVERQVQLVENQVEAQFFAALLAQEQARVVRLSVDRALATETETARRVEAGTAPKFQRLSAEVQRANLESQLVQAENAALQTVNTFKFTLGIPIEQAIRLVGELEADDLGRLATISTDEFVAVALANRPDVDAAAIAIALREIDRDITRSGYLPNVSAFANLGYSGSVPDNRTNVIRDPADPNNPFAFSERTTGFFSDSYWQPSVNVGVRLSWTLFSGFRTSAQVQQRQIAIERAQIEYAQTVERVRLDVEQARQNVESARTRILTQEQNVSRAELNYQYADQRLGEGVASPIEVREASDQLDQSRLAYVQAVHDYLSARSALEAAIGTRLSGPTSPFRTASR